MSKNIEYMFLRFNKLKLPLYIYFLPIVGLIILNSIMQSWFININNKLDKKIWRPIPYCIVFMSIPVVFIGFFIGFFDNPLPLYIYTSAYWGLTITLTPLFIYLIQKRVYKIYLKNKDLNIDLTNWTFEEGKNNFFKNMTENVFKPGNLFLRYYKTYIDDINYLDESYSNIRVKKYFLARNIGTIRTGGATFSGFGFVICPVNYISLLESGKFLLDVDCEFDRKKIFCWFSTITRFILCSFSIFSLPISFNKLIYDLNDSNILFFLISIGISIILLIFLFIINSKSFFDVRKSVKYNSEVK